jgi:solute carrier family 13 (sodium-dependent dicarboxylate transporter), member 2/3/5
MEWPRFSWPSTPGLSKMSIQDSVRAIALLATAILSLVLTMYGYPVLGIMGFAIVVWSLYPKNTILSSIFVIALLVILQSSVNVGTLITSVTSSYGTSGLWIIVAGFIIAAAMDISGLARRIAINFVLILGANPRWVLLSVALVNLVISPLSPSTTAKAFIMLPIVIGLIEAFNAKKGSMYAAALMLVCMAANNIAATGFLTATVPNPISATYMEGAGIAMDWNRWFVMSFPLSVALLIAAWILVELLFKYDIKKSPQTTAKVLAMKSNLGPMKREEKIVAIVFIAALLLWMTDKYVSEFLLSFGPAFHFINAGVISLIVTLLLFIPPIAVLKPGKFGTSLPWGSLFLFAAVLYLAKVVEITNAMKPVADLLLGNVGTGLSPTLLAFSTTSIVMLLHVFFTSTSVYVMLVIPLAIAVASDVHVSPALLALPTAFAVPLAFILPVNTIPNMVFFASGYFTVKQCLKYGLVLTLISIAFIVLVGIPYWTFLGLIR